MFFVTLFYIAIPNTKKPINVSNKLLLWNKCQIQNGSKGGQKMIYKEYPMACNHCMGYKYFILISHDI